MSVATLALASCALWETNRPLPPLAAPCQTSRADTGLLSLSLCISLVKRDTPPLFPPRLSFLFCYWHSEGSCQWLVLRQNSGSQRWGPNPFTLHCPSPTQGGAAWHMDWHPGARISGAQNLLCCPVSCHLRRTSWIGGWHRSRLRLQLWDGVAERRKRARSARSVSYLWTSHLSMCHAVWVSDDLHHRWLLQDGPLCCVCILCIVMVWIRSDCVTIAGAVDLTLLTLWLKWLWCFPSEINFRFCFVKSS